MSWHVGHLPCRSLSHPRASEAASIAAMIFSQVGSSRACSMSLTRFNSNGLAELGCEDEYSCVVYSARSV